MTVAELRVILNSINPNAEVMIEYCPVVHEYRTEYVEGVRVLDQQLAVILGVTALMDVSPAVNG